jgi:hypothetical protein
MARFEGLAAIRRALSMPNGGTLLDIKPDGLNWQWAQVPPDRARTALAIALAAIDGRWKLYLSLPDDPKSNVLEIVGISKTPDQPEPLVLYRAESGIGGYTLADSRDTGFAFDYNSSGKLDHLVFYRPGAGTIWVLRNNGGTFSQANAGESIVKNYDLADDRDRAFAFDYNSSGKLDHLVLYRPGRTDCRIFKNNGGTFTPVYSGSGIGGYDLWGTTDTGFAFDYNNVGKLDHLVFYRPGETYFWILRNNGGTFTPVPGYSGSGIRGYDLADTRDRAFAFDYNGNGMQDNIVVYRPGTGKIWILNSLN